MPERCVAVPGKWRAAAAYAALTLVLMYPLSVRPSSILPSEGPDTHLGIWLLSWDIHALTHNPLTIFEANTFYPNHRSLAYQDNYIASAILVAPVLWLTGSPIAATNAVVLFACVLCGLGAYVLARRLGYGAAAAFLCGLIFAFSPARFFRIAQLNVAPVQWIPFTLASLHAYLDGGEKRDLRLACGFFTLQTLTSGHGAVFLVVAILVLLGYRLTFGEPVRLAERARDLGIVGALLLLLAASTYVPYRMNQLEYGLRRNLALWNTTPGSFLASPTPVHAKLLSLMGLSGVNEHASGFLFPGYLPIALAAIAVIVTFAGARSRWKVRAPSQPSAARTLGAINPRAAWRDWRVRVFLASALVSLVLALARSMIPAGDGLVGKYYRDVQSSGPAVVTVVDPSPSSDRMTAAWDGNPPAAFSARWTGFLAVGEDGVYQFATTSDDGSRVFVDTTLVVDNAGAHASETRTGSVPLTTGSHRVTIEYVQYGGERALTWLWARDGAPLRPVPPWRLSQRRVSYTAAVAARVIPWLVVACVALAIAMAAGWLGSVLAPFWASWGARAAGIRLDPVPVYLVLALVCVGLSLGPPYSLWPYVFTWPGFSFIRVSRRFMVLAVLAIAVLAAAGFQWIAARLDRRGRSIAFLAAAACLVAEFAYVPIDTQPFQLKIPAADQWLASQPKPFAIAEVPVEPNERYQTMYMLHSMAHWQKTVAGYGGIRPLESEVLNAELRNFPDEISVRHLVRIRVNYVVVHQDLYPPERWTSVAARLRQFEGSSLILRYSDATSRVYSVALDRP